MVEGLCGVTLSGPGRGLVPRFEAKVWVVVRFFYMNKFGPFPSFCINQLREKLDRHDYKYLVTSSQEALEEYHKKLLNRPLTNHPGVEEEPELYFIEIPSAEARLLVKADLDKMGTSVVARDFDPKFSEIEYLCPTCGYMSTVPGQCPRHKVPLLEFSVWSKKRVTWLRRLGTNLMYGIAIIALALVAWQILS